MPRAPKVCNENGCAALIYDGKRRCEKHYKPWSGAHAAFDRSDTKARKTLRRKVFDRDGGMCRLKYPGCLQLATEIDRVNHVVGYSLSNCQAVCRPCHQRKSSREGHASRWGISGSSHG